MDAKRIYEAPELRPLGTVADLTEGGPNGTVADTHGTGFNNGNHGS